MARGQQKIQSQQKAAEKQAKLKKQQGHSQSEQKKAAAAALVHSCAVCKVCFHIRLQFYQYLTYALDFSVPDAWSKDLQAAFWEQTSQEPPAWWPKGCCLLKELKKDQDMYFIFMWTL